MKLYNPHVHQARVHAALADPTSMFVVALAGRQSGKTVVAEVQAMLWALTDKGSLTWVVSPKGRQCKKMFRKVLLRLRAVERAKKRKYVLRSTSSAGDICIEMVNGSRIEFVSAESEDTLRGDTVNYLILDEGAFIRQSTVDDVILPAMTVTAKKVLVTTTPKGKGWVKEWFDLAETDPSYRAFRWTTYDSPHSNKDFVDKLRSRYPERSFRQEFLAEWVDGAGVFNDYDVLPPSLDDSVTFCGIDLGIVHDATVLTFLDSKGRPVVVYRIVGMSAPEQVKTIPKLLRRHNCAKAYVEVNNFGIAIHPQILEENEDMADVLLAWKTTTQSKPAMVDGLALALEQRHTYVLDDPPEMQEEMDKFAMDFSPKTGRVQYAASHGHDDCVISLAIAWKCYTDHGKDPVKEWSADDYVVF